MDLFTCGAFILGSCESMILVRPRRFIRRSLRAKCGVMPLGVFTTVFSCGSCQEGMIVASVNITMKGILIMIEDAIRYFRWMESTVVTFNTLVNGLCKGERFSEDYALVKEML